VESETRRENKIELKLEMEMEMEMEISRLLKLRVFSGSILVQLKFLDYKTVKCTHI